MIVRRDIFEALGGFTTKTNCSEDTDLFLRADPLGPRAAHAANVGTLGWYGGLTSNAPAVVGGVNFMLAREEAGEYSGEPFQDPGRNLLLAGAVISATRTAFAAGHPWLAYSLLLRRRSICIVPGAVAGFPAGKLTSVLSLVRPRNYRFRVRPV